MSKERKRGIPTKSFSSVVYNIGILTLHQEAASSRHVIETAAGAKISGITETGKDIRDSVLRLAFETSTTVQDHDPELSKHTEKVFLFEKVAEALEGGRMVIINPVIMYPGEGEGKIKTGDFGVLSALVVGDKKLVPEFHYELVMEHVIDLLNAFFPLGLGQGGSDTNDKLRTECLSHYIRGERLVVVPKSHTYIE